MHVHHDGDVRTDALADGRGDGDGSPVVAGRGQFQSAVARGDEPLCPVRRGVGIPAGTSRIKFDPIPKPPPEQFMHRQVQCLALQVPQRDVARGEGVDVKTGRMPPLPHAFEEVLPQVLHIEGIRADQGWPAQAFHEGPRGFGRYATLSFAVADQTFVGRYPHHQGLVHV